MPVRLFLSFLPAVLSVGRLGLADSLVSFQPRRALPGQVVTVRLSPRSGDSVVSVRASFLNHRPKWFPAGNGWTALVATPVAASPGEKPFYLKALFASGARYEDVFPLTVLPRTYPEQHLRMPRKKTHLMNRELLRHERELLYAAFAKSVATPQWRGPFRLPVTGRLSSPWGRKRWVNGRWWGRHQGVDLAAAAGTPLRSDAAGFVVFAQRLAMRGNTVVVDHGLNLFTAYNHLSRIDVAVGQHVVAGQRLGTVGATGFVTGPHLHWEVRVGRTPVDPLLLTKHAPF